VAIKSQPEYIAWAVIADGCEIFKASGKCPPKGRLTQMYNRYGSGGQAVADDARLLPKGL